MKNNYLIFSALFSALFCNATMAAENSPINVFYYDQSDLFIANLDKELNSAAQNKNISLKKYNGNNDVILQSEQLDTVISQKNTTSYIVNLIDTTYAQQVIDMAQKSNSKVVFFNRKPCQSVLDSYSDAWYVGSGANLSGQYQSEILISYLKDHNNYDKNKNGVLDLVIIKGEETHVDTIARTQTLLSELTNNNIKYKISFVANGDWTFQNGYNVMQRAWEKAGVNNIEAIVSNNDSMALGAISFLNENQYNLGNQENNYIPVIGVDAIPEAIQAIKDKKMLGTVCQDPSNYANAILNVATTKESDVQSIIQATSLPVKDKNILVPYKKIF